MGAGSRAQSGHIKRSNNCRPVHHLARVIEMSRTEHCRVTNAMLDCGACGSLPGTDMIILARNMSAPGHF